MARATRQGSSTLSHGYGRERKWRPANPRRGLPAIIGATQVATGLPVIIKQWTRRAGIDDRELAEIWRDEIRQLYRLASFPGARDRLAMLVEPIEDPAAYTLVLASEQRVPLATLIDDELSSRWFNQSRTPRGRLRLWQELKRLAEGLRILHQQGLIHRNLDTWSVLTTGGSEPDFVLTGFEWSMRLTSSAAAEPRRQRRRVAAMATSFYDDWRALGVLAAQLLAFPSLAKPDEPYAPNVQETASFLLSAERDLLTSLLRADPLQRLDADIVTVQLDRLITLLTTQLQRNDPKLILAISVGPSSRLSERIRELSYRQIDLGNAIAQKKFVAQSLEDSPTLVRLRPRDGKPARYRLVARGLTYDIEPFVWSRRPEESWWVARTRNAFPEAPGFAAIESEIALNNWTFEVLTIAEADTAFTNLQGRTTRWDQLFKPLPDDSFEAEQIDRSYHALLLIQVVEALALAADIFPVRTVGTTRSRGSDYVIQVVTRDEPALSALSQALGLKPPATRLAASVANDQRLSEEWRLSEEPGLGMREDEHTIWRLSDMTVGLGGAPTFKFVGSTPPPSERDLFLRAGGPGHDSLLRRRLKALKALRSHGELLGMLTDPPAYQRQSHEILEKGDIADKLDESKAKAIAELWAILPLYLIQGPPGVGKTRLVQELVLRRLAGEQTERLLLTAQSHSAVDHLLDKVREELESAPDIDMAQLLPLRCRPPDRNAGTGDWDVPAQAAVIATRFASSSLVGEAPPALREAARNLALSCRTRIEAPEQDEARSERADRSFEALLLRSANLVFASSNASQLEDLIDEQARFDWAIVEEAGKATGVELLAPLLLSHRRLMIGDHRQLPPFNADQMLNFLAAPSGIRDALLKGRGFLSRHFAQRGLEDALDRLADDSFDYGTVAPRARELLLMFETFIRNELGEDGTVGLNHMGRRLEHQHRMHPAIAEVVSTSFYGGAIKTDEGARKRFDTGTAPFRSADSTRLPESPIVFIDMPFSRGKIGKNTPEMTPRWTNRDEAEACCDVLSLLRPKPEESPSIAVLSPYRRQVAAIEDAIERRSSERAMQYLSGFRHQGESLCGTVDSFQGNEADAVIISLVRNNHHMGSRALGFLADPKRMNVLISRAKWQLILVGSLEFLDLRFRRNETVEEGHELAFLKQMLDTIRDLTTREDGKGRPFASIVPIARLRGLQ